MATTPTARRKSRATRDTILEVATRLMQVRGYQATSVDDVLRESGIGKGSFYHYFASKEDLGHAILDRIIAAFLDQTLGSCFADPDAKPLTQVRCFLDRILETQRHGQSLGCPLGNLACELADVHEGFRNRLAGVFSAWQDRLTHALEAAQGRGDVVAGCQAPAVAQFLVASLEGAQLVTKVTKDVTVMEHCVGEMKRYLRLYEGPSR